MNLKKMERYLRVNLLGPGPRLIKKNYWAAVSQRLRNTGVDQQNAPLLSLIQYFTIFSACTCFEPEGLSSGRQL